MWKLLSLEEPADAFVGIIFFSLYLIKLINLFVKFLSLNTN